MRIITAGSKYLDIDAYAGIVAYAELLQKLGIAARAVSTGILNNSIPPIVRQWKTPLQTTYNPSANDTYTLIDVSNPQYFEEFVDLARVDEIIDHHPGMEDFWQKKIGDGALIEHVGAACTQVFEQWQHAGLIDQISQTSARLLMCGILDNTLNFGADITNERDRQAYTELSKYADVPDDWAAKYFSDCQEVILKDIAKTVKDDAKTGKFRTYPSETALGQFAIWDAGDVAHKSAKIFKQELERIRPDWCMNVIGIRDKKSYFVSDCPALQKWLEDLLDIKFKDNIATADRAWLRKEITKADIARAT